MPNAIDSSRESNPSRRICHLRVVLRGHVVENGIEIAPTQFLMQLHQITWTRVLILLVVVISGQDALKFSQSQHFKKKQLYDEIKLKLNETKENDTSRKSLCKYFACLHYYLHLRCSSIWFAFRRKDELFQPIFLTS